MNDFVHGIPNVAIVNCNRHKAYHTLFTDDDPVEIAKELNSHWLDPNFVMIAVPREKALKVFKVISQLT